MASRSCGLNFLKQFVSVFIVNYTVVFVSIYSDLSCFHIVLTLCFSCCQLNIFCFPLSFPSLPIFFSAASVSVHTGQTQEKLNYGKTALSYRELLRAVTNSNAWEASFTKSYCQRRVPKGYSDEAPSPCVHSAFLELATFLWQFQSCKLAAVSESWDHTGLEAVARTRG